MDEWMMGCAEGLCRRVRSRKGSCPTVRSDGAAPVPVHNNDDFLGHDTRGNAAPLKFSVLRK